MTFQQEIIKITNAKGTSSSDSFVGCCPIHDDTSPSLSIKFQDNDQPLMHCFSGCTFEELKKHFIREGAWPQINIKGIDLNKREILNKCWIEAMPLTNDCVGSQYLKNRGLSIDNLNLSQIRFNPALFHKNEKQEISYFPAILGLIKKEGVGIGLQRIYINHLNFKLDTPKVLGMFTGGYVEIGGNTSEVMHLAEGIETAIALSRALNQPVCAAVNAGNLSKVVPPKTIKTIHIWADKDKSMTGQKSALKARDIFQNRGFETFIHIPADNIPNGKKSLDYLDIYNIDSKLITEELNRSLLESRILPISTPTYDLPKLSEDYLPFIVREWTMKHAERLNIAPEVIIMPLVSVIGALIGRKLKIRPKRNDHWEVLPNLWCIVIAPPGTKKSPAISISLNLLGEIEEELSAVEKCSLEQNRVNLTICEFNIKDLTSQLKEATRDKKNLESRQEIAQKLKDEEESLLKLKTKKTRLSTNSSTIEKLIDLVVQNPNGILVNRDEISAIFNSFKKTGHETDRQFYLEGWNGDGRFKYDTIGRGEKSIEGLCLTLLGGTQPAVIKQILLEMKNGMNHDGFIQRFQLIAFPNQTMKQEFIDIGVPRNLDLQVKGLLKEIYTLKILSHGDIDDRSSKVPFVKLDDESYRIFSEYMSLLEKEVSILEDSPYKHHLSKFSKLFSSLILIFHVIDNIETKTSNHFAKPHTVEMAIKWTNLQKAHAIKMYDVNFNLQTISGFHLAKKIIAGAVKNDSSIRSIYQSGWAHLNTFSQVETAALFLENHNWLTVIEKKSKNGGRPSLCIRFNQHLPDFLKMDRWFSGQSPINNIDNGLDA